MILLAELITLYESAPSPHNMDGSFNVANVKFDNVNGLGNTPMGQNIVYRGAVAWIKPSVFRSIATEADRQETASELLKLVRAEKPIAAPFLELDIIGEPEDPKLIKVVGHEGRARADVFKEINGDIPMPVQLFPLGLRARHLCPEFFKWLDEHGVQAERSQRIVRLDSKMYYWNDQMIKPT